jgi:hypothetical protein
LKFNAWGAVPSVGMPSAHRLGGPAVCLRRWSHGLQMDKAGDTRTELVQSIPN